MKHVKPFFKTHYETEFERKKQVILNLIASEALRGHVYISSCFARHCEIIGKLGSWRTIQRYLNLYARKGWIKYNFNFETYGLQRPDCSRGYLCVRGMYFKLPQQKHNPNIGKIDCVIKPFYPTHFKDSQTGLLCKVKNPRLWEEE